MVLPEEMNIEKCVREIESLRNENESLKKKLQVLRR
jgi:ubiquinone biosynthesis protein UbiJ